MGMHYEHLTPEERATIMVMRNQQCFARHIARTLHRSASTITRELKQFASWQYRPAKLADATAASALEGFTAKLRSIAEPMRQTLTYDQGKEMSKQAEVTANTGVKMYFCDPRSPWQRGSCENINGLIRQYLPKGMDLSVYSQEQLDAIADQLNSRPRAIHGFYPPISVYQAMLEKVSQLNSLIQ